MREHLDEPVRLGTVAPLGAIVAGAQERAPHTPPAPASTVEDDAEREERQSAQRAVRESTWRARLPRRYATANLRALREQQHPVRLLAWLMATPGTDEKALNLLLTGPSRRGKTYAAYALGNSYVEHGGYAVAWSLADLNAALRPGGDEAAYDRVTSVDLLVLDDLGREQVSAWTLEQLQRVLDHRNREGLRTVMTTNLGHTALVERYGDPIVQRMLDDCRVLKVEGEHIDGGEAGW